jgi:hypothetical protein
MNSALCSERQNLATDMPPMNQLPPGHHFISLTFGDIHGAKVGDTPLSLGDGLTVRFDPPFELGEFWVTQLGELNYGLLQNANFAIVETWPHGTVRPKDYWLQRLPVNSIMYGILLQGMPHYDPMRGLSLAGNADRIPDNIIQSYTSHFYRHRLDRILTIDREVLEAASRIGAAIRSVYSGDQFSRLKRGFDAWIRGIAQDRPDYRLHEFVRALEALLMPERGTTEAQFIHRCKELARVPKADNVFREIYMLRSQVEHLNEWKTAFSEELKIRFTKAELGDRAMIRSLQIELLACGVYIKVLSDPNRLSHFADDSAIRNFWKSPCWAKPIGLEKLLNKRLDPLIDEADADRLRRVSS